MGARITIKIRENAVEYIAKKALEDTGKYRLDKYISGKAQNALIRIAGKLYNGNQTECLETTLIDYDNYLTKMESKNDERS